MRSGGDRLLGLQSQGIAQQANAAQAAQPSPAQPAQPSPPSRHRAGRKCCNLRCGRTRQRQLASTDVAVLGAGNLMVFARTFQNKMKNIVFYMPPRRIAGGLWGTCASRARQNCITCISSSGFCRSDTPLAARRIGSEPLVSVFRRTAPYRGANIALRSRPRPDQPAQPSPAQPSPKCTLSAWSCAWAWAWRLLAHGFA